MHVFLYLGALDTPVCLYALCMLIHPLGGANTHMSPYSSASVCSERHLHVVAVVGGPLHVGHLSHAEHLPHMGMPSHVLHPHPLVAFPVHLYV